MHVHVCLCMCRCVYVCVDVYVLMCACMCMYACVCADVCVLFVCVHVWVFVSMYTEVERKEKKSRSLSVGGGGGGQKELHTLQLTVTDQMAALNSYPQTGETALHLACKFGMEHIVSYLVTFPQLDVAAKNSQGLKPAEVIPAQSPVKQKMISTLQGNGFTLGGASL